MSSAYCFCYLSMRQGENEGEGTEPSRSKVLNCLISELNFLERKTSMGYWICGIAQLRCSKEDWKSLIY